MKYYDTQSVSPSGSPFGVIGSQTVATTQATIDFQNLPQNYKHLVALWHGRRSTAGDDDMVVRLNNDSGSNYGRAYLYAGQNSTGPQGGGVDPTTAAYIGSMGGSGDVQYGGGIMVLPNYTSSLRKVIFSLNANYHSTVGPIIMLNGTRYYGTATNVSRLTFAVGSGSSFDTNTVVTLYGLGTQNLADSTVVEKKAKISPAVPVIGETVCIALERGSTRLPRCIGKLQGKNFIKTTGDDA